MSLIIAVGTENPAKVQAVRDTVRAYPTLSWAEVVPVPVASGVPDQPIGFAQMFQGAKERARQAFARTPKCNLAIGLESGIVPMEAAQTGHMDFGVCAVYDGQRFSTGITPGFEIPPTVMEHVKAGSNLSQACRQAGLTNHAYIGHAEGIIGILTNKKMTRYDYTRYSIIMALIALENPQHYPGWNPEPGQSAAE